MMIRIGWRRLVSVAMVDAVLRIALKPPRGRA